MAKDTISMKKFKSSLTKISRLAKSGYKSITSVAKGIVSTVTYMASKVSVLSDKANWEPPAQSFDAGGGSSYYDAASRAEEAFLNRSSNNIANYKDGVIADIFSISDAAAYNSEQLGFMLVESVKTAFGKSADEFFKTGSISGNSFGDGFLKSMNGKIARLRVDILKMIQDLHPYISGVNQFSNITYSSPSYNFYSSGQTVSQQLSEARIADTVNALRGA